MNKSESIAALAAALAKAQGEIRAAQLNSVNPFFKSRYADLGAVIESVRAPFAKNGLAYSQFPLNVEGGVGVETILMHSSGEWLSETIYLPLDGANKNLAQAMGGIITYLRRYSLASIAGVYADEDTDGRAADARPPQAREERREGLDADAPKQNAPKLPPSVAAEIRAATARSVDIPSKKQSRATIKAKRVFTELIPCCIERGWLKEGDTSNSFHVAAIAAKFEHTEITDDNFSAVAAIVEDYYTSKIAASEAVEREDSMANELAA